MDARTQNEIDEIRRKVDGHDRSINALCLWRNGNGALGAERRIQNLEEIHRTGNCSVGKDFQEYLEEQKQVIAKAARKHSWFIPMVVVALIQIGSTIAIIATGG